MRPPSFKSIESPKNPVIAEFMDCFSRGNSRKRPYIPVEGPQMIREAIQAGLQVEAGLFHQGFLDSEEGPATLDACSGSPARLYRTSERLLRKAAATENPQGILALIRKPVVADLNTIVSARVPVLALVDVQDPGNCGALIRTFLAFGGRLVLTVGSTADLYGPKVIRASAGSILRVVALHFATADEFRKTAPLDALPWVATCPSTGIPPQLCPLKPPFILLVGNEGSGLGPEILASCRERISLPTSQGVESLNAAVAGSLVIYELARSMRFGPFSQERARS
jgi:RNA methyltransferase, TrmH family